MNKNIFILSITLLFSSVCFSQIKKLKKAINNPYPHNFLVDTLPSYHSFFNAIANNSSYHLLDSNAFTMKYSCKFRFYKNDSLKFNITINKQDFTVNAYNPIIISDTVSLNTIHQMPQDYILLLEHFIYQDFFQFFPVEEVTLTPNISFQQVSSVDIYQSFHDTTWSHTTHISSPNQTHIQELFTFLNSELHEDDSWCYLPDLKIDISTIQGDTIHLYYVTSCAMIGIETNNKLVYGSIFKFNMRKEFFSLLRNFVSDKKWTRLSKKYIRDWKKEARTSEKENKAFQKNYQEYISRLIQMYCQ